MSTPRKQTASRQGICGRAGLCSADPCLAVSHGVTASLSTWSDVPAQPTLGHDVHLAAEQFAAVEHEACVVQKAPAGFKLNQGVNVAVGSGVTAHDRAEDARPAPEMVEA